MYDQSTCCVSILFYNIKHDKIKKNCVILESISLPYNAQKFWKLIKYTICNVDYSVMFLCVNESLQRDNEKENNERKENVK